MPGKKKKEKNMSIAGVIDQLIYIRWEPQVVP